jgi:hypothetical protein
MFIMVVQVFRSAKSQQNGQRKSKRPSEDDSILRRLARLMMCEILSWFVPVKSAGPTDGVTPSTDVALRHDCDAILTSLQFRDAVFLLTCVFRLFARSLFFVVFRLTRRQYHTCITVL